MRGLERDERPDVDTGEKRILDESEIRRLLATAGGFRPLIALMLFTGIRMGEALGLTWADVDGGFLHVREQLSRKRQRVPLKTKVARRDIVLMRELSSILREHKVASRFSQDGDFVFASPDGKGRDHHATARGIRRAVDRARLGTTSPRTQFAIASRQC